MIFVLLDFFVIRNGLNIGQITKHVGSIKYALVIISIILSLVYAKLENDKIFKNIFMSYIFLGILYGIFKLRGVI
ncbi:MAG: hypothetical protein ACTHWZ_03875 [Peptoniphilaceae bacterium]